MAELDPSQFDDAGLKTALQRAVTKEAAPQGLHHRVAALLAAEAAADAGTSSPMRISKPIARPTAGRSRWIRRVAAAIFLLIGLSYLAYELHDELGIGLSLRRPAVAMITIPDAFANAMVQQHDAAVASATAKPAPPMTSDLKVIGASLQQQIGKQVAAVPLGDSWTLKSFGVTDIQGKKAAQLLFARGDATVSLLSVPVSTSYPPADGSQYRQTFQNHFISGFVNQKMIYCLIGNSPTGSLPAEELETLRAQVEQTMFPDGCGIDNSMS